MKPLDLLMVVVISLIGGAAAALGVNKYASRPQQAPIAIVDMQQIIRETLAAPGANGVNGADLANQALARAREVTEDLKARGYLVLNVESVAGAPPEYFVRDSRRPPGDEPD